MCKNSRLVGFNMSLHCRHFWSRCVAKVWLADVVYPCELGRSSDSFLPPSQCQTRVLSLSFLAGAGDLRGARCPQPSQSYNSYNKNTLPPVPRGLLLHLPVMYSLQRPHSGNTWKRFIVPVRGNVVCVHINSRAGKKKRNDILRRLCKLPCFCLYICRVLFFLFFCKFELLLCS